MSQDWRNLFGTIDVSTTGLRATGLPPPTSAPVAKAPAPAARPVATPPAGSIPTPSATSQAPNSAATATAQQQYPGVWTMAQTFTASAAQFAASGGKTVSREVREERLAICKMCPQFDGTRCIQCGCFIAAKTWMPHEKCPAGKWPT